jgi:preprotein translocase subunit SecG
METLVWIVHIIVAIAVIALVLLQHGKGADMGAAFGSGSSGSLFGATGSANFLSRATGILATMFFLTSLGLAYFGLQQHKPASSVLDRAAAPATTAQPAAPAQVPGQNTGSKAGDIPQ